MINERFGHGEGEPVDVSPRQAYNVLSSSLKAAVRSDMIRVNPADGPLRLSNFRHRVWSPALEGTYLEGVRIHDLRHTAASILISQGLHPRIVQQHLGHSSIVVTVDRYGHLYPSDTERVQDALDAAFETGLIGPTTSSVEPEADQMQTGA